MNTVEDQQNEAGEVDVDWIIQQLDQAGNKLPEEAIRAARAQRQRVTPRLITVLQEAVDQGQSGSVPDGSASFFAFFLLAEFRVREALPVILEASLLPDDLSYDLLGDAVTSALSRVIVSLAENPFELIDSLIRDSRAEQYVRWDAAQAYVYLVRDGALERGEAVQRLRGHLRWAIDQRDDELAGPLVSVLEHIYPIEARDDIAEAFRLDLVELFLIDMDDVERSLQRGEEGMLRDFDQLRESGIDDTIAELRDWASFQEEPDPPPPRPLPRLIVDDPLVLQSAAPVEAPISQSPRVGRNQPCPCGSGKKYKKCCGSPADRASRPK